MLTFLFIIIQIILVDEIKKLRLAFVRHRGNFSKLRPESGRTHLLPRRWS